METILITGAAGFIGSNLTDYFLKKGFRVIAFDNYSTGYEKNIQEFFSDDQFVFVEGDVRDLSLLESVIQKYSIDFISHQAARGSVPKSVENPLLSNDINVNGTLNILWAAKENNVKKVVCAISSSVYGDTPTLPKVEDMNCIPKSPYAITKLAKEHYCRVFYEVYGLPTVGLRYFNVYGRKQDSNGAYAAVIPKFFDAALKGEDLPINGSGTQTRDFTYIDDVIQANYKAIIEDSANGKSFNVAFGDRTSVLDLAENIIDITNSPSKILHREERAGDVKDSLASLEYARKFLKYDPQFFLKDGLSEAAKWYTAQLK